MHAVQLENIEDLWDELEPLLVKHWREVAHYQDIQLDVDRERYETMQDAGYLRCFTARIAGKLVGYLFYFVRTNAHYQGSTQAVQDVFFVDPEHRGGRMGIDLLVASHWHLMNEGVQVVAQHVKVKESLDFGPMLEKLGYEKVEAIYCKRLD